MIRPQRPLAESEMTYLSLLTNKYVTAMYRRQGRCIRSRFVFHVENGVGALISAWADRPQARQGLDKYSTVEKQFAFIRAEPASLRQPTGGYGPGARHQASEPPRTRG